MLSHRILEFCREHGVSTNIVFDSYGRYYIIVNNGHAEIREPLSHVSDDEFMEHLSGVHKRFMRVVSMQGGGQ